MTAQDPELSAALGWPGGISEPVLDRKTLLQMVAALRLASQQALEALEDARTFTGAWPTGSKAIADLRAALAQQAEPVEPVAGRAFLERILTAMEGVIDVADRKTDEFDALRSCVIDLTLMLHTAPPQRKPLTEEVAAEEPENPSW